MPDDAGKAHAAAAEAAVTAEAADTERGELSTLAADTATDARAYLEAITTVASGTSPEVALPVVLLAVSQVLASGARLGADRGRRPDRAFRALTPGRTPTSTRCVSPSPTCSKGWTSTPTSSTPCCPPTWCLAR
jgi:hypothetical protein